MRPAATSAFALLCALCLGGGGALQALDVGQDAPPLTSVTWVKGAAVAPTGKITVVEFWATWCGPCKQSIPHLTQLQKQYGEQVRIIGLSDEDEPTVKPFVAEMGDKMDYRVGLADKATHEAYMAGRDGIPQAFLIGADGKVVWAGHPMTMGPVLAQVVAGTFDAGKQGKVAAMEEELKKLLSGRQPQIDKAVGVIDQILALDAVNGQALHMRLAIANYTKNPAMVRETLMKIPLDQLDAETADDLVAERLGDDALVQRNLDLALAFSDRALQAEPANAAVFATRARLFATLGLIDEALALAQKGVALAPGDTALAGDVAYYRDLKSLHERAAAGGGAPAPAPAKTVAAPVP